MRRQETAGSASHGRDIAGLYEACKIGLLLQFGLVAPNPKAILAVVRNDVALNPTLGVRPWFSLARHTLRGDGFPGKRLQISAIPPSAAAPTRSGRTTARRINTVRADSSEPRRSFTA